MKRLKLIVILAAFISVSINAQTLLDADGAGNTYELINSVLAPGYDVVEAPDCAHLEFGRHIDEVYDSELQMYVFRFHMHVTPDNDRCINFDRQRNEIKTYDASPANLLGTLGETFTFKWKFKLDAGFQASSSFTHLHQLKAVGGAYEDMPLITFTARKGSPDKLELRYAAESSQSTIAKADLDPFKGNWVAVTETVRYGDPGEYSLLIVNVETGEELFSYSNTTLSMWKAGANFIRPKWGLYRSLNESAQLRDEMLYFANFSILEVKDIIKPGVTMSTAAVEPVDSAFEITMVFSEKVIGFTETDISVTNGTILGGSLQSGDNKSFKATVIPLATGNITVNIPAGSAADEAGNLSTAADELVVVAQIKVGVTGFKTGSFKVFPNPSDGVLNIVVAENMGVAEVHLFDQTGRLVLSQIINNGTQCIDIFGFTKGIYVMQIKTADQTAFQKIILQ